MMNRVIMMGRLTKDPELRRTGSGVAVASFSVAVDRDYGPKDGEKVTDFFDCVAWRQTGEYISKYFTKGRMIVLEGRLERREWTDKNGQKRTSVEINVESAYFGDSKKNQQGQDTSGANAYGANAYGAGSYAAPPAAAAPSSYPAAPAGGYAPAPAAPQGYAQPSYGDFAMLDDSDAQLPF